MQNRREPKWTTREKLARVLWACVVPFFRFSPRPAWGWRRFILRLFGSRIGRGVHVCPSVAITMPWNLEIGSFASVGDRVILYALGTIAIGSCTTLSQGAHLCAGTHDYRKPHMPLLKSPISVGAGVWICTDAFIGPGVNVGDDAIVGARAVAMHDVPTSTIVVGNPATRLRLRSDSGAH
jgi:putative colanic acid biosynthesis acetyltransferase WcaF